MAQLAIALFGSMRVMLDDQPIEHFAYEKVRALLACLALEPTRAWQRERLAELLWPNRPGHEARVNLRHALSSLRHALHDTNATPMILTSRDTIQLNLRCEPQIDTSEFTRLRTAVLAEHPDGALCPACVMRLTRAVELYADDLLIDLTIDDAIDLAEWLTVRRERLHQQALEMLATLCAYHEHRSEESEVERYAWRRIVLEPWDEEAHRLLMQVLARSGRRGAALAQYERLCSVLSAELGVAPMEETEQLAESLRSGRTLLTAATRPIDISAPRLYALPQLPAPATSLIGRDTELAYLHTLMLQQSQRLVTLCGPPGIGKTRLALALAAELTNEPRFADGIWFVPLAAVRDAQLVGAAIIRALGLPELHDQPAREQLTAFLQQRHSLLLIDNVEHLLSGMPLLTELLRAAPQLALLVTSREVLHLSGEYVYQVPPLMLPPERASADSIMNAPAVQLFLARAALHSALPDQSEASTIGQICQRLDGLPLAIELAAARTRLLTPAELLVRLRQSAGRRLDLLGNAAHDQPTHQRTLRDSIAWSYGLLPPDEARLLRRLGVFVGGFSLAAAESVGTNDDIASMTIDRLSALLDKSLVARMPQFDRTPRFQLLELIREFAMERLLATGELTQAYLHHAGYYAQLGEQLEAGLFDARQIATLNQLGVERANIDAALTWCLEQAEQGSAEATQAGELALRLGRGMFWYWLYRDGSQQGRSWLMRALAAAPQADLLLRARALGAVGSLEAIGGNLERAECLLSEQRSLAARLGHTQSSYQSCWTLSLVAWQQGQVSVAATLADECMVLAVHLRPYHQAMALFQRGRVAAAAGEHTKALAWLDAAQRQIHTLGCYWSEGDILLNLGLAACFRGDIAQARSSFQACLELWQQVGGTIWVQSALINLLGIERMSGHTAEAQRLTEQLIHIQQELGDAPKIGIAQTALAQLRLECGDYADALQIAGTVLLTGRTLHDPELTALALGIQAAAWLAQGSLEAAQAAVAEQLEAARANRDRTILLEACLQAGLVAAYCGKHMLAHTWLAEAAELIGQLQRRDEQAMLLSSQGCAAFLAGQASQAEQLLSAAIAIYAPMPAPAYAARAQEFLAATLASQGERERAIQLWATAAAARDACGMPIWPIDRAMQP